MVMASATDRQSLLSDRITHRHSASLWILSVSLDLTTDQQIDIATSAVRLTIGYSLRFSRPIFILLSLSCHRRHTVRPSVHLSTCLSPCVSLSMSTTFISLYCYVDT